MKSLVSIGDSVIVIDNEQSYTTYKSFFTETGREDLAKSYAYERTCPNYTECKVEYIAPHRNGWDTLAAIRDVKTNRIYLISIRGIITCENIGQDSDIIKKLSEIELLQQLIEKYAVNIGDKFDVVAIPKCTLINKINLCKRDLLNLRAAKTGEEKR